jgi:hypothetical protein
VPDDSGARPVEPSVPNPRQTGLTKCFDQYHDTMDVLLAQIVRASRPHQ